MIENIKILSGLTEDFFDYYSNEKNKLNLKEDSNTFIEIPIDSLLRHIKTIGTFKYKFIENDLYIAFQQNNESYITIKEHINKFTLKNPLYKYIKINAFNVLHDLSLIKVNDIHIVNIKRKILEDFSASIKLKIDLFYTHEKLYISLLNEDDILMIENKMQRFLLDSNIDLVVKKENDKLVIELNNELDKTFLSILKKDKEAANIRDKINNYKNRIEFEKVKLLAINTEINSLKKINKIKEKPLNHIKIIDI